MTRQGIERAFNYYKQLDDINIMKSLNDDECFIEIRKILIPSRAFMDLSIACDDKKQKEIFRMFLLELQNHCEEELVNIMKQYEAKK